MSAQKDLCRFGARSPLVLVFSLALLKCHAILPSFFFSFFLFCLFVWNSDHINQTDDRITSRTQKKCVLSRSTHSSVVYCSRSVSNAYPEPFFFFLFFFCFRLARNSSHSSRVGAIYDRYSKGVLFCHFVRIQM